jgi:iron(III) transport system ATP-binding protein
MAHVPSHHDHHVGEWIGIRLQVDHVVVFGTDADVAQVNSEQADLS